MDKIFKRLEFFKNHQLLDSIDKDISEFKQRVIQKIDFCRNEIKVDLLGQLGDTIESKFQKIEVGTTQECNFKSEV